MEVLACIQNSCFASLGIVVINDVYALENNCIE